MVLQTLPETNLINILLQSEAECRWKRAVLIGSLESVFFAVIKAVETASSRCASNTGLKTGVNG